jgi:hypothetical protein
MTMNGGGMMRKINQKKMTPSTHALTSSMNTIATFTHAPTTCGVTWRDVSALSSLTISETSGFYPPTRKNSSLFSSLTSGPSSFGSALTMLLLSLRRAFDVQ